MQPRAFTKHTHLQEFNVGPFNIKQPLPAPQLAQVSPFLLLHHSGPQTHAPGELQARLSPHPHRGFEPVTFLFSGKLHHKDSSGILHSEGPSAVFAKEGGEMEIIKLWVNLPREHKMTAPKYQDIKRKQFPSSTGTVFAFGWLAGELSDAKGPAVTFTALLVAVLNFADAGSTEIPIPSSYNALLYVLDGEVETAATSLAKFILGVFDNTGDGVNLTAKKAGKALLLAGQPINEPVASYGPFVMNYPGEIKKAVLDYEEGKMGVLES